MTHHKRAAADGETREECLLQETASKEAAMATSMAELQAELRQVRLALGNAHAEIDRQAGLSSQLKKVLIVCLSFTDIPNALHTTIHLNLEEYNYLVAFVHLYFLLGSCVFKCQEQCAVLP